MGTLLKTTQFKTNQGFRVEIRKRARRKARREGASHGQARKYCARVYMWINNVGQFLPLSNAPRCDFHPAWVRP
jgi:hypothetical protein